MIQKPTSPRVGSIGLCNVNRLGFNNSLNARKLKLKFPLCIYEVTRVAEIDQLQFLREFVLLEVRIPLRFGGIQVGIVQSDGANERLAVCYAVKQEQKQQPNRSTENIFHNSIVFFCSKIRFWNPSYLLLLGGAFRFNPTDGRKYLFVFSFFITAIGSTHDVPMFKRHESECIDGRRHIFQISQQSNFRFD